MTKLRLRTVLAYIAGWLCSASVQAQTAGTQDVTVLLFRTETVQRVRIQSSQTAVRLCARCATQRGPTLLDLQARQGAIQDARGKMLREVYVDGPAEVTTGGDRHATAVGRWAVTVEQGALRVSVVVPRERYVEAVLAAETAPQEPMESLKAMAVVARSFAAADGLRHKKDALCDTTHCQAMRLERVPDAIRDAVWNTSGETLWWNGKRVPAYFSQHCGGSTQDAATAWGGPALPWLSAHADAWCARVPSRWRASITEEEMRRALAAEGFASSGPIRDVSVVSRDRSGRVQQVRIVDTASPRNMAAATLRFALDRSLGWNQLRSDHYQVWRVGDRIVFEGNGHGHGVGLCQAGAVEMARAGKNYREILRTYFATAKVRLGQSDTGWTILSENGLALRTTTRDVAMEHEASQAFVEARMRWNAAVPPGITVTVFPSTETFRQATGQPGWNVAATQGTRIATQSPAILRAHGGVRMTLLHEFLHSFVEAEASPTAPLWLREGLVEVLNGETCSIGAMPSAEAVNVSLREASTLPEAQWAHTNACSMVRKLIASRGMDAVQGLLQAPEQR